MYRPPTYLIVSAVLPVAVGLLRRFAPRNTSAEVAEDNGPRLPYGSPTAFMWLLGTSIALGGFFLLMEANKFWASFDEPSMLTVYPTPYIWGFAPGFASLCVPWLATLWLMRRFGYEGHAAEIVAEGNQQMGWDGERIMRWLAWGVVAPIGLFTILAIPMHLSVGSNSVRVTHYAQLRPEVFRFEDARHAYATDGYVLRDGTFQRHPDLFIDFADGRRLDLNAAGMEERCHLRSLCN